MKLLAGAVVLFFLVGAPAFAHYQQDEKSQQQDKKTKPQENHPQEQQQRQPRQEQRTRPQEQNQQRTAPKEQQRAAQQQQRSRAKEQQNQQRTAQKEQQRQQQQTARQEQSRSKQEQQQSRQQAKTRQQQEQRQQYAREQRPQQGNQGHGQATRANYHANDIHPRHGGRVIADASYDAHFGSDHHFHAHWRHDADRFQYGGYWFTYAEPWPSIWLDSDDLYIVYNYDDDDYYLCDADHPGVELLIVVES